jgi:hypothetical protein
MAIVEEFTAATVAGNGLPMWQSGRRAVGLAGGGVDILVGG